jgi:hypothetical protein
MMTALVGGGTNMPRVGYLDDVEPIQVVRTLRLESQLPDIVLNPSVCVFQGRLMIMIRHVTGDPALGVLTPTENYLGELSADWGLVEVRKLNDQEAVQSLGYRPLYGFEDLRLFVHEGKLLALAATAKGQAVGYARATMCLLDVEGGALKNPRLLQSPRYERNWIPVVTESGLRLIYSISPLVVLSPGVSVPSEAPAGAQLRGSSQAVRWGDGYIAVVHETAGDHKQSRKIEYTHRFVTFSEDLTRVTRIGRPFCFQKRGIEFCAGLTVWPDRGTDRLLISYGVDDKRAYVSEVSDDVVTSLLGEAVIPMTSTAPMPSASPIVLRAADALAPPVAAPTKSGGSWDKMFGDSSSYP